MCCAIRRILTRGGCWPRSCGRMAPIRRASQVACPTFAARRRVAPSRRGARRQSALAQRRPRRYGRWRRAAQRGVFGWGSCWRLRSGLVANTRCRSPIPEYSENRKWKSLAVYGCLTPKPDVGRSCRQPESGHAPQPILRRNLVVKPPIRLRRPNAGTRRELDALNTPKAADSLRAGRTQKRTLKEPTYVRSHNIEDNDEFLKTFKILRKHGNLTINIKRI